jgi:hypothetical protein
MTITIGRPSCPSVFDAGLLVIDYEHVRHPNEAHAIVREARRQAPTPPGRTDPSC